MATRTWNNSAGGNFNTATDWTPNIVPGVGDDASITAAGTYTVTSTTTNSVGTVETAAGATLAIGNNTTFTVASSIGNAGTITLNSIGNGTELIVGGPSLTLSGGGHVTLTDNANNYITAAAAADVLTNVNNTIAGSGQLGNASLTLVNQAGGTIDATGSANQLVLDTNGGTTTNTGLIEDTGTAGLRIVNTLANNAGGTIEASGAGTHVDLQSANIRGGSLQTSGGGVFQTVDTGSIIDGSKNAVTDAATIDLLNNTQLTLRGSIANSGTFALNSIGNATELHVDGINTTLSGGGTITMTDNANNYILGNAVADTLTNVNNTISGAGQLGNASMTLVNQAGGTINGTGVNNALVVDTNGADLTNQGLMEGTAAGGLEFVNTGANNSGTIKAVSGRLYLDGSTIDNGAGGVISAQGAGAHIDLQNAAINGGTLTTDASSVINTLDQNSNAVDNVAFTNDGSVEIANDTFLTLGSTVTNAGGNSSNPQADPTGGIFLNSIGNATELRVDSNNATLQGGGHVTLSDNANNYIVGLAAADTLTNVDNTISGAGQFGNGTLTFVNDAAGVVDGTGANALVVDTGGNRLTNAGLMEGTSAGGLAFLSTGATNTGTLEATNGGRLLIQSSTIASAVGGTGQIEALGTGSHVDLQSATLTGGKLTTDVNGTINTLDQGNTVDNVAVTNAGTVNIENNTILFLGSTVTNSGNINISSSGNVAELRIDSNNATLQGGGHVTLGDNPNNYIYGNAAGDTLTNVDNTISGAGQLGDGQLTLINGALGTIDATSATNQLVLNTNGTVVQNSGKIEDTGAAGLLIVNTVINQSKTGLVEALTSGDSVFLQNAQIIGGGLTTVKGALIQTLDSNSLIAGAKMTNAGTVQINNDTALTIRGTLKNTGTIALDSIGNTTELRIDAAGANLSGGKVTLTDNANNLILSAPDATGADATLTNSATISGAGNIGNDAMILINQTKGVLDATGTNALVVELGNGASTNQGLMEGTSAGGLTILNSGDLGNSGTIKAINGGRVLVQNSTIRGVGTTAALVEALGTGSHVDLATADLVGGKLTTDIHGTINTLDTGSIIDNVTFTNAGTVNIENNTILTLGSTVTNSGTINISSSGNTTELRIDSNGATLQGGGHVTLSDNPNNYIFGNTSADTLTNVDNTISGAGQLGNGQLTFINEAAGTVDGTGSNVLNLDTNNASNVTNAGLMEGTSAAGLAIVSTPVSNTGTIEATGGGRVLINSSTIASAVGGTGQVEALGTGSHVDLQSAILTGGKLTTDVNGTINTLDSGSVVDNVAVTNAGTINIENDTVLTLGSTVTNSGTINISSSGNSTELVIDGNNATLQGGGHVTLSDNANNLIFGKTSLDTLTNVNDTISGAGQLGDGVMTLVNGGTIDGTGTNALVINTGSNAVTNSSTGTVEASGAGGVSVSSGISNSGKLWANGSNLNIAGAVTGGGTGEITGSATLEFGAGSTSTAAVGFDAGSTGIFQLDSSQSFAGTIAGLSLSGANELDLRDISYISGTTKATFVENGGGTQGVLTVTDGTHTANLTLLGNYASSTFVVGTDSHGGTFVHDPAAAPTIAAIGAASAHA